MSELKEVPTEELLSFQDYPASTQSTTPYVESAHLSIDVSPEKGDFPNFRNVDSNVADSPNDFDIASPGKTSFWSIEYFQKYFDVDTQDVRSRIWGSIVPSRTSLLRAQFKLKPDLYGPIWIAITLIFTIAISGNIANYLQQANAHYRWKYDFHLVSYAATTIFLYISLVPICLWGLLKWSLNDNELEEFKESLPSALELICIYGYSLFIYIPVSMLWTIQIGWLQWLLVIVAASVSGMVLLFTLSLSLDNSRHKIVLGTCIIGMHLLLATGFMLFFFHVPNTPQNAHDIVNATVKLVNLLKNATAITVNQNG